MSPFKRNLMRDCLADTRRKSRYEHRDWDVADAMEGVDTWDYMLTGVEQVVGTDDVFNTPSVRVASAYARLAAGVVEALVLKKEGRDVEAWQVLQTAAVKQ
jgi:hypothetical protein